MNRKLLVGIGLGSLLLFAGIFWWFWSGRQPVEVNVTSEPSPLEFHLGDRIISTPSVSRLRPQQYEISLNNPDNDFLKPYTATLTVRPRRRNEFVIKPPTQEDVLEGGPVDETAETEARQLTEAYAKLPLANQLPRKTDHYYLDVISPQGAYRLLLFAADDETARTYTEEARMWIRSQGVDPNGFNLTIERGEKF